jgi:hypothetical protein
MNGQPGFHNAETVMTPAVPAPATVDLQLPTDAFGHLNQMLDMKLATAIIKKQKMQYSIVHFAEYPPSSDWMLCEVENLAGNAPGDDLVILIQKITPVTLYITGAVKNAPTFTAN